MYVKYIRRILCSHIRSLYTLTRCSYKNCMCFRVHNKPTIYTHTHAHTTHIRHDVGTDRTSLLELVQFTCCELAPHLFLFCTTSSTHFNSTYMMLLIHNIHEKRERNSLALPHRSLYYQGIMRSPNSHSSPPPLAESTHRENVCLCVTQRQSLVRSATSARGKLSPP